MKLLKDYLKNMAANCNLGVEIYRDKFGQKSFHTDNIEYLDMLIEDLPEEVSGKVLEMDESEYNATINANSCEREIWDEGDTMLCILLYQDNVIDYSKY